MVSLYTGAQLGSFGVRDLVKRKIERKQILGKMLWMESITIFLKR